MNRQIVKLFAFIVVLFGVLIGFTSYWSVFDAKALKEKDANKRPLLEQQQIKRGRILAADGTVIARSVPKGHGSGKRYVRRYPQGRLYGHPIGYSFVQQGDSEFEQFHNDQLVGEESEFGSILDQLRGRNQEGNDIVTSIDPAAQATALRLEAAGFGAVVAIEPKTGRVKVMASNPPYDPNRVPYELGKLNTNEVETPLVNRATHGQYPPGSTFKVVTAAAGLESGTITPETPIDAPGSLEVEGTPLENDFGISYPGATLDTALTNSVNTELLASSASASARTPCSNTWNASASTRPRRSTFPVVRCTARAVSSTKKNSLNAKNDPVDLARVAIGQERLAGHTTADGGGGGCGRQQGQVDEAADLEQGGRSRRARHKKTRTLPVQSADQRQDRRRADHRDGRGGQRRNGYQRGRFLGCAGGGQDRHRGNSRQRSLWRRRRRESGLVHRLRPGRRTEDRVIAATSPSA